MGFVECIESIERASAEVALADQPEFMGQYVGLFQCLNTHWFNSSWWVSGNSQNNGFAKYADDEWDGVLYALNGLVCTGVCLSSKLEEDCALIKFLINIPV